MVEAVLEEKKAQVLFEEDPSFSVIVPIYDIKDDILRRCLRSIDEQNYENMEVLLVFDGPNESLSKVAAPYLSKNENWRKIEIEHAGACAARNAGFAESKGDIVSFCNSDYILKPGIIRLWVDRMLENKDCGFLYGGYQYTTSNSWWYPSKPFDPYLLEVANYIDCGFPLWRKYFVPWDVNCKSLQDWDFWLRVVKTHKVKGYFLERDISFLAEPPRPKGLSADSSSNWIERVKYVKGKNKIQLRDLVVTSLGAPNHGIEIAKLLKADYRDDTLHKPNEYKGIYMLGFYIKPGDKTNEHGPILSSFPDSVKKVVHWIGADIYWLRKFSYEDLKALGGALKMTALHLVESEKEKKQLKELLGIDAEIVPIPPSNDYKVKASKDFKAAIFLTDKSDFDKYLKEHTLSIVRACPDIQFTAYGDAAVGIQYPNLKCFGVMNKEEWKKYVYENSCLIRIARHDTVPLASNEFMMAGKAVISNIPEECTHYVNTAGDSDINRWDLMYPGLNAYRWPATKKQIVMKLREIKKGWGGLKAEDLNSLKERFSKESYINRIYQIFNLERPK